MKGPHRTWLLSGGIGSGKSTVRRLMDEAGVSTIDSDSLGHQVLEPGSPAFAEVVARWPSVLVDGVVDRAKLASIVFQDPSQLQALEEISHPRIFDLIRTRLETLDLPVVVEIPLLDRQPPGEWGRIVVDADDENRTLRLLAQGRDRDDVEARMRSQPDRAAWLSQADLVIPNQSTMAELRLTVDRVVPKL